MKAKNPNTKRIVTIVLCDLVAFLLFSLGVCAIVFDFFGGDKDQMQEAKKLATPAPSATQTPTDSPAPTDVPETGSAESPETGSQEDSTPQPTQEPTPEPTQEPTGLLKGKYAEKFSLGEIVQTDTEYRSENVAIELTHIDGGFCVACSRVSNTKDACEHCGQAIKSANRQEIYIADIYLNDLNAFHSYAISRQSELDKVKPMAEQFGALLACNSDYYLNSKTGKHGWFVRDGVEIARFNSIDSDLCILYADGTMDTIDYKNDAWSVDEIYAKYPQHIWYFGPVLLDNNGQAKTEFNFHGHVAAANPRTVLGYYEPGHYAILLVDGARSGGESRGLTAEELSVYCAELGLAKAYNLDGGGSSCLYFSGNIYGPNGRGTSDIIYIAEPNAQ